MNKVSKNEISPNYSREKIIEILEKVVAKNQFQGFHFAEPFIASGVPHNGCYALGYNRVTYVYSGTFSLMVGSGKKIDKYIFPENSTLVMRPYCLTGGVWETSSETLAMVSYPSYMRIIHAVYDRHGKELTEPTYYYHLKDTLRRSTVEMFNVLCTLQPGEETERLGGHFMTIILAMLLEDIKNSQTQENSKAIYLWQQIIDYLDFSETTGAEERRSNIAKKFCVTETYISRLFSRFSGMTYKEYLRRKRLQRAQNLLEKSMMTISEIAGVCGYSSPSYFIRDFQSVFQTSPGNYRQRK